MSDPMGKFFELLEEYADAGSRHSQFVQMIPPLKTLDFTVAQLSRELDARYKKAEDTRDALVAFVRPFIEGLAEPAPMSTPIVGRAVYFNFALSDEAMARISLTGDLDPPLGQGHEGDVQFRVIDGIAVTARWSGGMWLVEREPT